MTNFPNSPAAAALEARWGGRAAVDALEGGAPVEAEQPSVVAAAAQPPATESAETEASK